MKENKKHQVNTEAEAEKQVKTPVQPEKPLGDISSSGDSARQPERDDTPPDEQTRGNP